MHYSPSRNLAIGTTIFLLIACLVLASCSAQSGPLAYDSGANNLSLTSSQLTQYNLFRFDTASGARTLTLPPASDIVSAFSVSAGSFTAMVVAADGSNAVTIKGGSNVTVKPSAAKIAPDTTQTIFIVLNNVSSGSQAVTVY
jgi:hypothetical protein